MSDQLNSITPPLTLSEFIKQTRFPRSSISWLLRTEGLAVRPNFFRIGRRLFITVEDANLFIQQMAEQGYTPGPSHKKNRRLKVDVYGSAK